MAKCTNCGMPLENEGDACSCNTSLCTHCCECGGGCGCGCGDEK